MIAGIFESVTAATRRAIARDGCEHQCKGGQMANKFSSCAMFRVQHARDSYVIAISVAIRHFVAFLCGHLLRNF